MKSYYDHRCSKCEGEPVWSSYAHIEHSEHNDDKVRYDYLIGVIEELQKRVEELEKAMDVVFQKE